MLPCSNRKFLQQLIRKAVIENTQPTDAAPSTESVRGLMKYVSNSETCDTVYEYIIERGDSEMNNNGNNEVLLKCASLLKTHLSRNKPSIETLAKLEAFCQRLMKIQSPALQRSMSYLRAIINRQIDGLAPELLERWNNAKNAVKPDGPAVTDVVDLESYLITNLTQTRVAAPATTAARPTKSLLESIYFGGQFKRVVRPEDKQPEIDLSERVGLSIAEVDTIQKKVQTVREAKIKECAQPEQPPSRFKLFQYKYYTEQTPLVLPKEEVNNLIESISKETSKLHQHRAIDNANKEAKKKSAIDDSSNIIIKLFCDIYANPKYEPAVSDQIISFFLELLSAKSPETKIHAFNLLFNLSLHINLLEEGNAFFSDTSSEVRERVGESARMKQAQQDLYSKVNEMLLFLLQKEEKDTRVWTAGMTCWLCFVTYQGKIKRKFIHDLDVRILAQFVETAKKSDDDLYKKLMRLMVNALYDDEKCTKQNQDKLAKIGGIKFILDHYTYTDSYEVRQNLFTVIFDYIVISLSKRKNIQPEHVATVFEFLYKVDAPIYLVQIFKFLPEKFVENFVKFLFFDLLMKDPTIAHLKTKIDRAFIVALMYELEKLASSYLKLKTEFETRLNEMLKSTEKRDENLSMLRLLLNSKDATEMRNGEAWLFALLRHGEEKGWTDNTLKQQIEALTESLYQNPEPRIRQIYIRLIENLMMYHRSKFTTHGEENKLKALTRFINDSLTKSITNEIDKENLLAIFNLIMGFISVYSTTINQAVAAGKFDSEALDDISSLFLRGLVSIPYPLLKEINISMLHHIFIHTKPRSPAVNSTSNAAWTIMPSRISAVRTVVLLLIIEKTSRYKPLTDSIGGMNFFKELLKESNPQIAFFASKYIMEQLQKDRPDEYNTYHNQLMSIAQQTNNEKLLENSYLQLKNILQIKEETN